MSCPCCGAKALPGLITVEEAVKLLVLDPLPLAKWVKPIPVSTSARIEMLLSLLSAGYDCNCEKE
jgi:hypothetical protein